MNPRRINETWEPATWPEILSNPPFMQGYADYWTGAPWPDDDPVGDYEIGRLFAAELDGLGEGEPKAVSSMRRLDNGWKCRINRCPGFLAFMCSGRKPFKSRRSGEPA